MNIKPKTIFLIDGLGAILSAFMLGVVLVKLQDIIGMPVEVLYLLAFLPCLFLIYSFSCYFFLKDNWSPYLKFIALVNFLYCLLSISKMFLHREDLTTLGFVYFIVEIIIVLSVAALEYRASHKSYRR